VAFGDSDLDVFLSDFGVTVSCAGVSTRGVLDAFDERLAGHEQPVEVVARMRVLTIKTGSLPGVAIEASIVVDGTTHAVRDILRVEDGALTHVYLVAP
jgi:hypothetical protein